MAEQTEDRLGMTEEQWQRFQEYTHGYGEQDENGVDLSMIRENLKLKPTERIIRHDHALAGITELVNAAKAAGIWRDIKSAQRTQCSVRPVRWSSDGRARKRACYAGHGHCVRSRSSKY